MSHGHLIERCSCGVVIAQCRCFAPNKTERVIPNGCPECKTKGAPRFELTDKGRAELDAARRAMSVSRAKP